MTRRTAAKKNQPQPPLKSILKPSAAENTIENEKNEEETLTDATDADLTDTVITKSLLKELFEKNYKKIVNEFNKTIESLKSQLDEVEARATNAEKKIKLLETENQKLKEVLNSTSNTANANANAINALEERIEDRTNRQLRKTMVFRGVPENDNETWDDTKSLLAAEIAKVLNTEETDAEEMSERVHEAEEMLERVHRAAPNPHYKGSAPRPIFAAFNYWPDTVEVIDKFREHNINNDNDNKVTADYKYGPLTTKRRSLAMLERKKLKESNAIVAGYVAFPARLMVKTSNRQGSKYKLHKDFSKEKVQFKK